LLFKIEIPQPPLSPARASLCGTGKGAFEESPTLSYPDAAVIIKGAINNADSSIVA